MRMKPLLSPALLPALVFCAAPLAAQPQEARLEMGVGVQFTLPAGWQAEDDGLRLSVWAEAPETRAMFIESPSPVLQGAIEYVGWPEFSPVLRRPAVLMGEPVTLYRMAMREFRTGDLRAEGGDLILAQFGRCIEPVTYDQISEVRMARSGYAAALVVGFYSAGGFDGFDPGDTFDTVLDGLALVLPSHLAPCPADHGAPLEALDAPLERDDGRVQWSVLGLDLTLPATLQPNRIDAEEAQFLAQDFPAGSGTELRLFTESDDFDFAVEMIERDVEEGGLLRSTLEIAGLGQAALIVADMSDDARYPAMAHLLSVAVQDGFRGLSIVTEADDAAGFDAAAVRLMQRAIVDDLAPAGARPAPDPLVLGLTGRMGQRDAAEEIEPIAHDLGDGLTLRAGLPPGWEALELTNSLSLMSETAPRRLIMAALSYASPLMPDDFVLPISRERGFVGGQPAVMYHAASAARSLGYMTGTDQGGVTLALLDQCIGSGNDARPVTVVLYSEAGMGAPTSDAVLAGVLAGLELDLPATAAPCPVGLTDPLEALITPEEVDGMRQYGRFGLNFTVPAGFEPVAGSPDELVLILRGEDGDVLFELVAEMLPFQIEREDIELDFDSAQIINNGEMRLGDGMVYERFDMRFVDERGTPVEGVMLVAGESRDGWTYLHLSLFHRAGDAALAAVAAQILDGL